ncbi:MAG: BamA/TamA family outer membrane protein, partial [Salegentibacter sp.]
MTPINLKIFLRPVSCVFFFLLFFNLAALAQEKDRTKKSEVSHTFYITSNTGLKEEEAVSQILQQINKASRNDDEATLLLVGNVTGEDGYPSEEEEGNREKIQQSLRKNLLQPLQDFHGNVIFTPGVNEWNKAAPQTIDDLESYLQDNLKGSEFWPSDGCPLEKEDINDKLVLEMVDSQWFLENWDDHPDINNKCDIKTREQLFIEFKDDLKDSHGKTIVVAVHHPVMSNTKLGFFNKIAGFSTQAYQNEQYRYLRGRLKTLAKEFESVIFVSGNDRNLQFIEDDGIPQIISGAVGKTTKAKARKDKDFASEKRGYAKLTIFRNGNSKAEFFTLENGNFHLAFSKKIKDDLTPLDDVSWHSKDEFGKTMEASIYTNKETTKTGTYKFFWGEHYRKVYSRKINAPVLFLDTLPGNLQVKKEGGGMQSRSLRLVGDDKHEYTLRALRKSAVRFLQAQAVKDHYIEDYLENTVAERYVQDFYTTAHPYAPFAVNDLANAINLLHVSPEIYYVPKQKTLGTNNDEYGDGLYMLEAHPGDENKDFAEYGKADDILSTSDLLLEMRESKDIKIDGAEYIRARLFDMLIGDWDRHYDQWRWAEYKQEDGSKLYRPIPRDRDYAFPKYDGFMLGLLKAGFPELRKMESYDGNVDNVKWFNYNGFALDNTLITQANWNDWKKQVEFIQNNLSDEVIKKAFETLPPAAQDSSIARIQKNLKARRGNLEDIARRYYKYLNNLEVVTGTEEDDVFDIQRLPGGKTKVSIETGGKEVFSNTYDSHQSKMLWVYGLDGEDTFRITGEGDDLLKMKVLGGEENDIYDFQNTRRVKLYDYKSKKNTVKNPHSHKWLVDSYDINSYDPDKHRYHTNKLLPSMALSRDAGLQLGLMDTFTTYGLVRNPFTTRHKLGVTYYFMNAGLQVDYEGEFAQIFKDWNFAVKALYTNPSFTMNYFGTGNETYYNEDEMEHEFNRVQIQQWELAPFLRWHNDRGSSFEFGGSLESQKVNRKEDHFIAEAFAPENEVFDRQLYGGVQASYGYKNLDNPAYPSRGIDLNLLSGYKTNIDDHNNHFGYVKPSVSIDYPLHPSGAAVLATKIGGEAVLGDHYEFYDAATLGGNNNLRAYRFNRFNGKRSFYQTTDLRVAFTQFRTDFIPLVMGVTAGFDYGRVWTENG